MKKKFIKKLILTGIVTFITINLNYISASAKWVNDAKNNWSWIENEAKAKGWKKVNQNWYYFNSDGIMNTGWLNYNGSWYYLSNSGEMITGWKTINGKWYHFNSDGLMSIGWINDNGTLYFANSGGEMETGTLGIDGEVYTFSNTGAMMNKGGLAQDVQAGPQNVSNENKDNNSRIAYVVTNSDSLNVRAKANTSSDIIGSFKKGTEIKILDGATNGFYPVVVDGKEGWVSSQWISFENSNSINSGTSSSHNNENKNNNDSITSQPVNNNEGNKDNDKNTNLEDDSLDKGTIRDTQPSLNNKYYYSDDNLFYKVKLSPPFYSGGKQIKGNCTWYAWGRAWELTGKKPDDAGFIGNAYEWWAANKKSGKYQYGSQPRVGAIAVWKSNLPNSGGSGHVAMVEKINGGKIYISESTWNGVTFRYREIYETDYLYGYIYLDKPNF